jgi:hypothetical protein
MHQSWITLFHDFGNLITLATAALNLTTAVTTRRRYAATTPEGDRHRRPCRRFQAKQAKPQQTVRAAELGTGFSSADG